MGLKKTKSMALCQSLVEIIGCNDFESAICVVVY